MQLQGILERSLGGFVCIRGFAPLGDLANISQPNPSIQRDLIITQSQRIKSFLSDETYLFFPEIILAYTIKYNFYQPNARSGFDPLMEILQRKGFQSNVDKISIWSQKTGIRKVKINIPNKLLRTTPKPFDRIDGNHRLSAVTLEDKFKKYITPFCLILLNDDNESEAKKRVIFHNINYKSIPLTPEENYKLIIDESNSDIFEDDRFKENSNEFGWHYYFARKLYARFNLDSFESFNESLFLKDDKGHSYKIVRTFLVELFKLLINENLIQLEDEALDIAISELIRINAIYEESKVLRNSKNYNLIIAFLFFHIKNNEKKLFESFKYWVIANKVYELDELNYNEIIELYTKRMEARKGDIFVSMDFEPYYDQHYTCIREAVNEFNEKHNRATEIKSLRMDSLRTGTSFNIYDEMNRIIENSSLLIADLSNGNRNVYNEVGYLMGLNKGRGNATNNFILIMQKNVTSDLVGFNLKPYQRIRFENSVDLKEELLQSLEIHFGFRPQES